MNKTFPYRYRVLILLFFLILITYLDRICIALVGVRIKSEFHLTNGQFGWVLAAFSLAYALFEFPSGLLSDRIGQRAVLIRIVLWWSIFTALTGLTTGLLSLIIIRFLFGVGEAGAFPTSSGVISHWFPSNETARGLSAVFIGQNIGSAIAPLIVVSIAAAHGWRATFFVNGAIGVLWVFVCYLWFQNNPAEMKGISAEEKNYIEKNRRFKKHDQNFSLKAVLKNRSLRSLVAAFFCSQWGNYFYIAWMPVFLQEGKHFSENQMKLTSFYVFATGLVTILITGILSDWISKRKGLRLGRRLFAMLALGGSGLFLFMAGLTSNIAVVTISLIVGHLFFAANGIISFSACVDIGGSNAGAIAGIMNFFGQMGAFFLVISFGQIADLTHNFNVPLFMLSGVLVAGCLLWLFVKSDQPVISEIQRPKSSFASE